MKIHNSSHEEKGWINIGKELPPVIQRVRCASINIIDWNIEECLWEGIGYRNSSGRWVKIINPGEKGHLGLQITHWKHKEDGI